MVTDDRDEALAHAARVRAGGDRGVPRRPRGLALRDHRRRRPSTRSSRPRTSSGSATATPAPTPAAWAPTRRCRGRRRTWSTRCCATCCSRPSTRWPAAARRSPACCTPASRSPRAALRVVEFNARFGDPETQPLLALLDSPLAPLLLGAATGTLAEVAAAGAGSRGAAVAVVLASAGYPDVVLARATSSPASRRPRRCDGVHVIHAGTAARAAATLVTAGGRVLAVVGTGDRPRRRPRRGVRRGRGDLLRRRPAPHRHRRADSRPASAIGVAVEPAVVRGARESRRPCCSRRMPEPRPSAATTRRCREAPGGDPAQRRSSLRRPRRLPKQSLIAPRTGLGGTAPAGAGRGFAGSSPSSAWVARACDESPRAAPRRRDRHRAGRRRTSPSAVHDDGLRPSGRARRTPRRHGSPVGRREAQPLVGRRDADGRSRPPRRSTARGLVARQGRRSRDCGRRSPGVGRTAARPPTTGGPSAGP